MYIEYTTQTCVHTGLLAPPSSTSLDRHLLSRFESCLSEYRLYNLHVLLLRDSQHRFWEDLWLCRGLTVSQTDTLSVEVGDQWRNCLLQPTVKTPLAKCTRPKHCCYSINFRQVRGRRWLSCPFVGKHVRYSTRTTMLEVIVPLFTNYK